MRLFTAIDIPYEVRRNLDLLIQHLRPSTRVGWVGTANLHITLKFIGDWASGDLAPLIQALHDVPVAGDLPISIQGLGWFPNAQQPRVFYAGVQAYDGLKNLAQATDMLCTELDISPETKPYHPHLTLARVRHPGDVGHLQEALTTLPSTEFGRFTATHFHLYESRLQPGGSAYVKLASYPLTK